MIAETSTFAVDCFVVQQRPRQDNPYWAVFIVFLNGKLIGKQFSRPTLSDCRWLERSVYAEESSHQDTSGPARRLRAVGAVGIQRCLSCGAPSGLSSKCQKCRR